MSVLLRQATREDAPVLLELIKALALYEREPEAVVATVEDIERDGFGPTPLFECTLAELDGVPVGFALFFTKWSTWRGKGSLHLEDLFVDPRHRGLGIGVRLLSHLAGITVSRGYERFEWEVLDWNMLARDFYHQLGATHKEGWFPYRLEGEALHKLASRA